mgnify:CR=1 FL=1|tara:strand:- start:45 stop:503 length:459 start_codon:yes stop_codon:yes gene_type:complete
MTKQLTNKEAYEIIRDNTSWAYVYPQDVKFKYGWIFHRTRSCYDGEYHECKEPIECYAIDSLYSYEHTGYQIEAYSGCEVEDSPFITKNDDKVRETIRELNSSYYTYKTDIFIERIYERVYGGSGQSAVKKYSRDDLLEKLEEWSNKIEEEN